jgi:two-component system NarL family sensor kinase
VQEAVRRTGVALAVTFIVGAAVAAVGFAHANAVRPDELSPAGFLLAAGFLSLPLVGAGLLWVRPGQPVARLLVVSGILVTGSQLAVGWAFYTLRTNPGSLPFGAAAAWLVTWTVVPGFGLGPFVLLMFPDGQVRGRLLRGYAGVAAVGLVLLTAAQALAPDTIDGGPRDVRAVPNPLGVPALKPVLDVVTAVGVLLVVGLLVVAVVDLARRYRRAVGEEKQQLRWVATAAAVLPVSAVLSLLLEGVHLHRAGDVVFAGGQVVMLIGLSSAFAVAVLRHRLYDLDVVVSRSLLYAALTTFVTLGYVGTVALVGLVVRGATGTVASLVAVGVVALAFQPVRLRLQRAADRVVRGTSGEPYAALAGLGARLADALEPAAVPQVLVEAVVRELRIPYAALEVEGDLIAAAGTPGEIAERLDVSHRGTSLATLLVAARPGRSLRASEQRLLRDLAHQAGAALRVTALAGDVQRARELAVSGREEERRRLRRELHDGVGPTLAGLALQAGALRQRAGGDLPEVRRLEEGLALALAEVRRAAHGLRPPALDELGLGEALRQQCAGFSGPGLLVEAVLPPEIPPLPAATEVAVLRIAAEALANVARHARARHCCVRLETGGVVVLEVTDDGVGGAVTGTGVGLPSMRERAEEIGGSCVVAEAPGGGTRVRAVLGEVP